MRLASTVVTVAFLLLVVVAGALVGGQVTVLFFPLWLGFAGIVLAVILAVTAKPEHVVYAYVIIKILFPKMMGVTIAEGHGASILGAELIMTFALILSMLFHWRQTSRGPRRSGYALFWLLLAMYAATTYLPALLHLVGIDLSEERRIITYAGKPINSIFAGFAYTICALVALLATVRSIDTPQRVQRYLLVVVVTAAIGSVEGVLTWYFGLFPSIRAMAPTDPLQAQRLSTVTIGGYDAVGRWVSYALLVLLGLLPWLKGGRRFFGLVGVGVFGLVIVGTFSRGVFAGLIPGLAALLWLRANETGLATRRQVAIAMLLVSAAWVALVSGLVDEFFRIAELVRPEFLDPTNYEGRLALWDMMLPAVWASPLVGWGTDSALYFAEVYGGLRQSVHNMYLHFLIENGALALVTLVVMAAMVARNLVATRRLPVLNAPGSHISALEASVYSILIAAAIMVWTDSGTLIVFFYWTLVYFSSLLRQFKAEAAQHQPAPAFAESGPSLIAAGHPQLALQRRCP